LSQTLMAGSGNGDSVEPAESLSNETTLEKNRHDSESFDLFVQFVDKLRDRTKSKENA